MSLKPTAEWEKQLLRHGFDDFRRFVNPLIYNRAQLAQEPWKIVGTTDEGQIVDADGNVYEDLHGTQMLGHRRREITEAVMQYLESDHPTWWPARVSPWAGRMAAKLEARTGYDNVFFAMSGSDVVEAAIKLGRAWTGKPGVISLHGAYHGCHMGSTAMMAAGLFSDRFGPHLPGVRAIALGDVDALRTELERGDVGSVIVEPIQGEGGVRPLPQPFVEALCDLTKKHGALLVADEVQTGMGRTGRGFLFSTAVWPREPDAVLLAKALGGGLVPLAAMLTRASIFQEAYGANFASGESHNVTFGFNSLGMSAGIRMMDLVTDELIAEAANKGARLKANLHAALDGHPMVKDVRGEGLMLGIELIPPDHPWFSFESLGFEDLENESPMSPLLCHRLYKRGFFAFSCGHDWNVLRLQPRLPVPEATLDRLVDTLKEELDELQELAS
jgi:acetylornithine/succinyldiaminopimelate/putrescine aminotransferase